MREYFTYGSVRGAASDGGPYRDRLAAQNSRVSRLVLSSPPIRCRDVLLVWSRAAAQTKRLGASRR